MFEYFLKNYVWNLSVDIAIESGAQIGEIDEMCRPLRDAAARGEDAGTGEFLKHWVAMADKLVDLAAEDEARGRNFSAGTKLQRASLYYTTAERMQGHGHPGRGATYAKAQDSFRRAMALGKENAERIEIPYQGGVIAGLYTRAPGPGPKPVVVYVNGLDSCKELLYWSRLPQALLRRGISTLCIDQPGSGEALRLHNLPATHKSEEWASKVVDWLETQDDVDTKRIGITGISLGGYYTPRAVAFEPRFALGVVWGANHNWAEVQHKRLAREGENPVPHYWAHVSWVFGAKDMDDFFAKAEGMTLNGVVERIKVPFLVTHGQNDRQISLDYAHQTYDQLVNSPKRELKIFTPREGGIEHVGVDNMSYGRDYIADWIAETFGEQVG
ncbi:alpha/beta hydrolase family protein [Nitrospirillum sp. BR 11828]|uniref:alpha/beta hydrolase family protein n=1 Tax=Nitrospirillum sp. BR 11828 TaxID=3104325 RepID=UPI002ACAC6A5|nr:alpha/beta fold hydrolase [Nitrospirillum sp. BR 11828]MDZ5645571.1 alpha/beta fold hydrolase [Nitrospirillum sp. BR 11828]